MKFLSCCCLVLFFNLLSAQAPDETVKVDSSQLSTKIDRILKSDLPAPKKKNFLGRLFDRKDYPNPQKALYLALLLPGSGQIYNKQYWKTPFIYGAYTGAFFNIRRNRRAFKRFRDSRIALLDDDPNTINQFPSLDETSLQSFRDAFLTKAETGFLILLAIHVFQAADAFVFAHLKTFEVNDDLSLHISPQVGLGPQQEWNAGINVGMSFTEKKTTKPFSF